MGQWSRIAATVSGTTATLYVADTDQGQVTSASGTISTGLPTGLTIAGRSAGDSTEWFSGRLAHMRIWSAVLTGAEIVDEWASLDPVRTDDLWAAWPLEDAADLTDHSGAGRDLAAGTTAVTTEDGPPITEVLAGLVGRVTGRSATSGSVVGAASRSLIGAIS